MLRVLCLHWQAIKIVTWTHKAACSGQQQKLSRWRTQSNPAVAQLLCGGVQEAADVSACRQAMPLSKHLVGSIMSWSSHAITHC